MADLGGGLLLAWEIEMQVGSLWVGRGCTIRWMWAGRMGWRSSRLKSVPAGPVSTNMSVSPLVVESCTLGLTHRL